MIATLNRWGNSEAIRIPKVITEALKIHPGDKLDISIENDVLLIKKAELKGRDLVDYLLKDYEANDPRLKDEDEDWEYVGEENW